MNMSRGFKHLQDKWLKRQEKTEYFRAYPAAPVTMAFLWCRRPISKLLMVWMPFIGGLLETEDMLAIKTDKSEGIQAHKLTDCKWR